MPMGMCKANGHANGEMMMIPVFGMSSYAQLEPCDTHGSIRSSLNARVKYKWFSAAPQLVGNCVDGQLRCTFFPT